MRHGASPESKEGRRESAGVGVVLQAKLKACSDGLNASKHALVPESTRQAILF